MTQLLLAAPSRRVVVFQAAADHPIQTFQEDDRRGHSTYVLVSWEPSGTFHSLVDARNPLPELVLKDRSKVQNSSSLPLRWAAPRQRRVNGRSTG